MSGITVAKILAKKGKEKITVLTAYDYPTAKILEEAGVDIILVGDSLGTAIMGYPHTLPVTVDEMIHHTKAVRRGAPQSFIVTDLPFGSYGASVEESLRNTARIIKLGDANAVKLEGGVDFAPVIESIVRVGIPVMGHIGLKPQSVHKDGYRIMGKTEEETQALVRDAQAIEQAGAFAMVIEGTTEEAAREISQSVKIPTIGIGGGRYTDGQVLVITDMLGWDKDVNFKHNKRYIGLHDIVLGAVHDYIEEVKSGAFPTEEHTFHRK